MSLFRIGVFFSVLTKDYSKSLHRHTHTNTFRTSHYKKNTLFPFKMKENRKNLIHYKDFQYTIKSHMLQDMAWLSGRGGSGWGFLLGFGGGTLGCFQGWVQLKNQRASCIVCTCIILFVNRVSSPPNFKWLTSINVQHYREQFLQFIVRYIIIVNMLLP